MHTLVQAGGILVGDDLVHSVWAAVGTPIVAAVIIIVIFKFFVGANKNIPAGIGILVVVAGICSFLVSPQTFIDMGTGLAGIITGGGS